jgi:hypothetical protein
MGLVRELIWKQNAHDISCDIVCARTGAGPVTDLLAGSTFTVSWYLGYAHSVST